MIFYDLSQIFDSVLVMLQRIRTKYPILYRRFTTTSSVTERDSQARVISSGIQPTGVPHLGNYLGAIKPWVELQKEPGNILYFVADLHGLTTQSPDSLHDRTIKVMALLLACGINPNRSVVFKQSDVSEHTALFWVLSCLVKQNIMSECTEWKWKSKGLHHTANLGLFNSPILDAADILLYKSNHVPVGNDQIEVLELCRLVADLFNKAYGEYFPLPECLVDSHAGKIRNLRDPSIKMSKSHRIEAGKIILTDSDDAIRDKFQKAVVENTSTVTFDPSKQPGLSSLIQIHSGMTGMSIEEICLWAQKEKLDTNRFKAIVSEAVIDHLRPIQMEYERLMRDKHYLEETFTEGGKKAKEVAAKTWNDVIKLIGLKL